MSIGEIERGRIAEEGGRDAEARKKIKNLQMVLTHQKGLRAGIGMKRILRVKMRISRMKKSKRITLKVLMRMKSLPYLRNRTAIDK